MSMNIRNHGILIILMLTIALSTYFVVSATDTYADTSTYSIKVTSSTLNVRSGPSNSYAILGNLKIGDTIAITGTQTKNGIKWYKLYYKAKTGYINSAYTKLLSTSTTLTPTRIGQAKYTTNVRSGPSTSYPSVAVYAAGQKTYLYSLYTKAGTAPYSKWYRVYLNGKTGYVIADFVTVMPTIEVFSTPKTGIALYTTAYRTSPDAKSAVVAALYQNSPVTISALYTTYTGSAMNKWYQTVYNGTTVYVYAGYVTIPADNFEAYLTAQGFPESYKPYLRSLHASNPKWIFKAQLTGLDWSSALSKEQVIGKSLLSASTSDAWKSFDDGAYDFTTETWENFDGKWNAADKRVVAHYFDPRNFLTQSTVFQFLDHSFDTNSQNTTTIRSIATGTFLNTSSYATWIYNAGKAAGVNPNVLTSMIRQEQGTSGTSDLISGTFSGYQGLYNFLNVGAYATSTKTAVQNGLWYARGGDIPYATTYGRPWNTKEKAISGGANYYGTNYVSKKQNTLYLKKFNVLNGLTNVGVHQYMTHILGADNEAKNLALAYATTSDYPHIFCIPVYNNMPATAVSKPGTVGNNDNVLNSLKVINASTEQQYSLVRSTGTAGFTRYSTSYTVNVPATVSKIIINGIGHNNLSYVSAGYATTSPLFANLPAEFKNVGSTTNQTTYYSAWIKGVTTANLNVRDSASTSNDPIGSLSSGKPFYIFGEVINPDDGSRWYIMSYYGAPVYGNGVYQLSAGTNVINVTVKSTSGVSRTYTITVNRT